MGFRIRDAGAVDVAEMTRVYNALLATTTIEWTDEAHTVADRRRWQERQRDAELPVLVAESDEGSVRIDARESQRYALAVGDENPVYFDEGAAQAAGHPTIIAPPTFLTHAIVRPRALAELRVDGLWHEPSRVRLDVERIMFGGEEWDFVEPVCVGDTITAETRLADLDQKDGSKGPFVRVVREKTFINQTGAVVARSRQVGIAR